MSSQKKTQRGFTLIEMSIVLVIIGLIVGGILKGQEIIESARQKNMASLYDQIKAAQNTFLDRYRALPGDYKRSDTTINANVAPGDGDGFIDDGAGGGPAGSDTALLSVDGTSGEPLNYFNGLIAAQLFGGGQVVDGTNAATAFSGGATQSPLPSGPWSNSGLTIAEGTYAGDTTSGNNSITTQWLRLTLFTSSTIAGTDAPLTVNSAFQMDQKFDDGLPTTGRIRSSGVTSDPCGSGDTNAWNVTGGTGGRQCDLYFSMQ